MHPSRTSESRSPRLLPPIVREGDGTSSSGSSHPSLTVQRKPGSPGYKLWSYYHRGCVTREAAYSSWAGSDKRGTNRKDCKHYKNQGIPYMPIKDGGDLAVIEFLNQNKAFLEAYVVGCVPLSEIERWLFKKMARTYKLGSSNKSLKQKDSVKSTKKQVFMELVKTLQKDPNEHAVVWELARCITTTVGVDAYRVFKLFPDHPTFVQYFVVDQEESSEQLSLKHLARAESEQVVLVLEVARSGSSLSLSRDTAPDRFPKTPHDLLKTSNKAKEANHVLYQPILTPTGRTAYVVEMWRISNSFRPSEEETSSNFLVWGSLALHYCNMYLDKTRERNMSDFLLDVVKAIFEEMVSLDQLIKRILEFAQRLVNADRASLFLVDYRNFELVSTVFDLKFEPGQSRDVEKKEIRMPINRGIAGHVALSGETMNIPDAYSDYRFNREVDETTGYKTISILCMPIKVQGKVIGVVQMVNKRNDDSFHHEDEVAFEIFSTFFGLALHHARLYDRISRKEQKYRVALEVLSYHNTCRENEVQAILCDKEKTEMMLNDFYLDPYKFNEFEKCKAVITMFNELFDLSKFDIMTVTRFILTVKKNYRTVPYHNFDHGWSVAHCMYVILKNDAKKRYSYKMRLALFVACLCHDLDHRGYTNKYMSETASPLAAMYTTSTLEHHHFNITVTILQQNLCNHFQDGHNIFSHITSEEYKEILGLIRQNILATDLAAFFPNLAKMKELQHEDPMQAKFTWVNNSHRDLAMALSMTAADLSASAKPWEIQIKTVKVIFEEFYDQGDKEKAAGRTPIPMMDRNMPDEQPASQVGFLSQICIPCYSILYRLLPNTKPMYIMALKNLHNWKAKASRVLQNQDPKVDATEEEFEVEDISEEILLEGMENVIEDNTDTDDDAEVEIASGLDELIKTEPREAFKGIRSNPGSWDEEESANEDKEKVGGRLSKDIEGVTWIDEEGLVVRPNDALKVIISEEDKIKETG